MLYAHPYFYSFTALKGVLKFMTLNIHLPPIPVMKPKITVFGVGGAGGNATNNMIYKKLEGATFIIANTDAQALEASISEKRIQLGQHTTQGLGAGADPEIGKISAEEARDEIQGYLQGSNMVFITAGMGGGTGTGASSVIARIAREMGILTVGVVTKPFHFEGPRRMKVAEQGIAELQKNVDTLIVIPNQNLFRIANEKTTFAEAFAMADEVLHAGVRGVTDLMVMPGLINLDFADIRTVMSEMGKAMMGTGEAEGEKRAQEAADAAISNPLLDNVSMKGAKGVLINITGGSDMTLFEVDEAANRVREEVDPGANVIFGSTFDEEMRGRIRVSVVATGIDSEEGKRSELSQKEQERKAMLYSGRTYPKLSGIHSTDQVVKASAIPGRSGDKEANIAKQGEQEAAVVFSGEKDDRAEHDILQQSSPREVFVAPSPIQPESYASGYAMQEQYGEAARNKLKAAPEQRSLFSRMTRGMSKPFHTQDEGDAHHSDGQWEEEPNMLQKTLEPATVSSASDRDDLITQKDLLDIPAFLRRNSS